MPTTLTLRFDAKGRSYSLPATLLATGVGVRDLRDPRGAVVVLGGFPDQAVLVTGASAAELEALSSRIGRAVLASYGMGQALRLRVDRVSPPADVAPTPTPVAPAPPAPGGGPVDLYTGVRGAEPLWLHADGRFSTRPDVVPDGEAALTALVRAARWVSTRRTTTFERLFAVDHFHPERGARGERLTPTQGEALRAWLMSCVTAAGDTDAGAQLRSAAITVLSHLVATRLRDPAFAAVSEAAGEDLLALVAREPRGALRAHTIGLLQLRGPALTASQRDRARDLVRGLVRAAPPYAELRGPWRFAMCSAWDFHEGECEILVKQFGFKAVPLPAELPWDHAAGGQRDYDVFEAPFRTPDGEAITVWARSASPSDENQEMGDEGFVGLLINRHAQLGAYDMRAAAVQVEQRGYKLVLNSQCAGLTTRFAFTRLFPDADVYSSWDSTYFRTDGRGGAGKVVASEGLDCFVAILRGMAAGEDHARLNERIRDAQWSHDQAWADRSFVQFVGPAHPLVLQRYQDVNRDGRADVYDGFYDFTLASLAEDARASSAPRDPGVAPSQVSGPAADGLNWAAGSMNRVVQYSDLWAALPDQVELLYAFSAGGFYSAAEPPVDVDTGGRAEELGRLPAVCRYVSTRSRPSDLRVECLLHAWLAHTGRELKRLLVAAEALNRAFDVGALPAKDELATPLGRRGMLLLTLAGLLDFPADQNWIDGQWAAALRLLNLPDVSRSLVRGCITEADHDASNYYGSWRGLRQLVGVLRAGDPVLLSRLSDPSPDVGRARPLELP